MDNTINKIKNNLDLLNEYGSPLYIYDYEVLKSRIENISNFRNDLESKLNGRRVSIHYSTKANNNPSVIRKYYILRLHNGVVDKLETKLNGDILSFETNKFSTYALTYEDVNNPKTGDNIIIYLILGLLSIIGILYLIKKQKDYK